jgi:hypothetical protein
MRIPHISLSAAMVKIESLTEKGYTSFKLFREAMVWYIIVNGEGK